MHLFKLKENSLVVWDDDWEDSNNLVIIKKYQINLILFHIGYSEIRDELYNLRNFDSYEVNKSSLFLAIKNILSYRPFWY